MNGPVDDAGWMYAPSFSDIVPHARLSAHDHVRRRKWIRMRKNITTPVRETLDLPTVNDGHLLVASLQSLRIDRERNDKLASWITENPVTMPQMVILY